jgi:N-terminal acetyltransferase B complex non-catalytic subunit
VHKLLRFSLHETQLTVELESARATLYVVQYLEGLKLGAGLPPTELQPADDLAILTGNVLVHLWHLTSDDTYLYNAAAILEFASTKSKHSFQIRLLLIQIHRLLGIIYTTIFISIGTKIHTSLF